MCDITTEEHRYYMNRRVYKIENVNVRNAVLKHSAYMYDLLSYCHFGMNAHSTSKNVPQSCIFEAVDVMAYKTAWEKHILSEPQSLIELKTAIDKCILQMETIKTEFMNEDCGTHSSYSDYSDSDTESDEVEDILVSGDKSRNGNLKK